MNDIEMYEGFDLQKQQEYEKYMVSAGIITQKEINDSWKNVRNWDEKDWKRYHEEGDAINHKLVDCLTHQEAVDSTVVQALIDRHFNWVKCFWAPTRESYIGLGEMYLEHGDFKSFYDKYHPELVTYLVRAMKVYAQERLR